VDRPRLSERLNAALVHPPDFSRGFTCRLTLVCGPAGFGKTTLVASWLRDAVLASGLPDVVWMSLTTEDNDSDQFAASLLARLESEAPALAPGTPLLPTLGNILLAGIAQRSRPLVLVLDDYHAIVERDIHAFIGL
jgi:LuxR family maltose regulon positive regulatory protein